MKKYTRPLRIVLWLLVLMWMAVIFCFSMENADESSSTSGAVIRWLLERFDRAFPALSPAEQFAEIEAWSFAVRKLAHFLIFAVLGFLTTAACSVDLGGKEAFLTALAIGIVYAATDEIHQAFVPGRACQFRDVLIDASGVLLGAGSFTLIRLIRRRSNTQK
ncbi:MAG: VanZ family protein [Clostridia bacterium]|nr:VanZ family protein [Clostridia bacterium]MBR5364669.1 VanZ family protein [Clostridia bacterium]